MTSIPPVNPSGVPVTSTDSIITETANKKIGTSESITVEPSTPMEAPPSDRDQKIIDAFINMPDGVPSTTAPATSASTTSTPAPATTTEPTTDATDTETYSKSVTFILNSTYVQNSPSAKEAIEENPDKVDQGVSIAKKQKQQGKKDLEEAQKNSQAALDSYKVPEAGTDTQSSKYSGS